MNTEKSVESGGLAGKVILVTGAGSGIGKALALGFARDGANVVALGRRQSALSDLVREAGSGAIHPVVGDLANAADLDRLFAEIKSKFGGVHVVINNAAVYPKKRFLDMDRDEWNRSVATNLLGLADCCRQALRSMLTQRSGRILNIGSFAWKGPDAVSSDYVATKAAVAAFTRALAVEINGTEYPDIRINEFIPGIVKTGMSAEGMDPGAVYPHARAVVLMPAGSAHGATYLLSTLHQDHPVSLLGRIRRKLTKMLGGKD
jgi:NAD(P)-dependent dehydrogenase (short-subunit alcohol dehydrogenase family)